MGRAKPDRVEDEELVYEWPFDDMEGRFSDGGGGGGGACCGYLG